MKSRRVLSWVLLIAIGGAVSSRAGEADEILPKPTDEGVAALQGLMKVCVEDGALEFIPRTKAGRSRVVVKDASKLRKILQDRRDSLTPALCDTLLTTSKSVEQSLLLEAVAELRGDKRMLAFAAMFRGEALEEEGNAPEAVKKYADAVRRFEELRFPGWQARTLGSWAAALSAQADHDGAYKRYAEALALIEKTNGRNHVDTAICHVNLGNTDNRRGRPAEALAHFRQALEILERLPEEDALRPMASVHRNIGSVLLRRKDPAARKHFEEAVRLTQRLPAEPERVSATAQALANLGFAQQSLRDLPAAQQSYERALELLEGFHKKPHPSIATVLGNLGALHYEREDRKACLDHYVRALRMQIDLHGNRSWDVVEAFHQLATAQTHFGDHALARHHFEQGRKVAVLLGGENHPAVGDCLAGLAEVALTLGDYRLALDLATQEKLICERYARARPAELASCRNRLGHCHHRLGQDDRAVKEYREAMRLWTQLHGENAPLVASASQNVGNALAGLHQFDRAEEALRKALEIRQRAEPRDDEAIVHSLNSLGSLAYSQGNYQRAAELHSQALDTQKKLRRVSSLDRAGTLNNLGMSHFGLRQWPEARTRFDEALVELRVRPRNPAPPENSPEAAYGFSPSDFLQTRLTVQLLHQRGLAMMRELPEKPRSRELSEVSFSFVAALSVLEQLRGQILESEESRSEAAENVSDLYALLVGVNWRQEQIPGISAESRSLQHQMIFKAAEFSSGRAFVRTLARSRADLLAGLPSEVRQRREELERELHTFDEALRRAQSVPALERNVPEIDRLLGQRQDRQEALKKWQEQTERDFQRFADFQSPTACSLTEARSCLGPKEVALLYITGTAESFVVVLEGGAEGQPGVAVARLPKAAVLAEWLDAVLDRGNLSSVRDRQLEIEGYQMLLAPIAERIRGKDLVIVPTGELCHLPFELLVEAVDAKTGAARYLIEGHRIRYAPSMTVLHLQRQWEKKRAKPERTLWALGDPIYEADDPRAGSPTAPNPNAARALAEYLSRMSDAPRVPAQFRRLPHSAHELTEIRRVCGAAEEEVVTGMNASEAKVKTLSEKDILAKYRYIHFATHGILGLDDGRQPSLVLTLIGNDAREDGFLQLDEVMRLRLNADLVVLSACETGRGRLYNGEGVRGLARAFLHAGSRGVVCSLWQVGDRETAGLMATFYRELDTSIPAAEALRRARCELIRSGKPPLYWAPFVLVGE